MGEAIYVTMPSKAAGGDVLTVTSQLSTPHPIAKSMPHNLVPHGTKCGPSQILMQTIKHKAIHNTEC